VVNFINILHAAFTQADPESAKKDSQVKQLFALSGSASVKAGHKHVDEIESRIQICHIFCDRGQTNPFIRCKKTSSLKSRTNVVYHNTSL